MKYIDAEKLLKAEIERLNSLVPYENNDRHDDGLHDAYKEVKNAIDSLQKEQQEVDLEKEVEEYIDKQISLAPNEPWDIEDIRAAVRFGAEWMKEQTKKTIEL